MQHNGDVSTEGGGIFVVCIGL